MTGTLAETVVEQAALAGIERFGRRVRQSLVTAPGESETKWTIDGVC